MATEREGEIVVVDEIGKMECMSELFRNTLIAILDSDHPVIGSVALRGNPFIEGIKRRNDVLVVKVTEENREELVGLYSDFLREKAGILKGRTKARKADKGTKYSADKWVVCPWPI
jgi:nucleoside-triphosphatase THEP1